MRKFVLNIEARIDGVQDEGLIYDIRHKEEWNVPNLRATFEFETSESLYNFIHRFALTMGAKEPK